MGRLRASRGLGGIGRDGEFVHHDSSWLFGVISLRTLVAAAAFFGVAGAAARSKYSENEGMESVADAT